MTVRGCGRRIQAGVYLEVPLGPRGRPVEDFIVDPPRPVDVQALGLSPIGVKVLEDPAHPGTWHVHDVVGGDSYPNVADFVEEVRRHGASRRIARTSHFGLLGPESRLFLYHRCAHDDAHEELAREVVRAGHRRECPRRREEHAGSDFPPVTMCAASWWSDVVGGSWSSQGGEAVYARTVGDTTYRCWPRPPVKPSYRTALFMTLPIARIAVVRARDGSHEASEHAARQARLPVVLEDE